VTGWHGENEMAQFAWRSQRLLEQQRNEGTEQENLGFVAWFLGC